MTPAVIVPFGPTTVTGAKLFLMGDLGMTNSAGTYTWLDQTANHNDFTQSTAAKLPTIQAGGINGVQAN